MDGDRSGAGSGLKALICIEMTPRKVSRFSNRLVIRLFLNLLFVVCYLATQNFSDWARLLVLFSRKNIVNSIDSRSRRRNVSI